MSRLFSRGGRLAIVGVAAAGLALSSLVVAVPSASSSTVVPKAAILKLDHFLCYHVTTRGFKPPSHIALENWLQPTPFVPQFGVASTHCNPTIKQVPTATGTLRTFKVVHPLSHLLCWAITYAFTPRPVNLVNQFGKEVMQTTGGPTSLCLPSWKKRTGNPNQTPNAPTNLDHFACYGVTPLSATAPGFKIPPYAKVRDEFSPRFVTVKIQPANLLCIPTTKIASGKTYPPANPKDLSLTCFPINKTPYWKQFFDENQFGQGSVFPTQPVGSTYIPFEELCLPTVAKLG
jgi:hypothetical protein